MRIALIGQPNCGKSTLFNQVAGYKAETGNFSGTTVSFTENRVRVAGEVIELVDLPGTYTLEGGSPAEEEAARYLDSRNVDVIVNVADSTHFAAALECDVLSSLPCDVIGAQARAGTSRHAHDRSLNRRDRASLCDIDQGSGSDSVALSISIAAAAMSAEPRIRASSSKSNLGW